MSFSSKECKLLTQIPAYVVKINTSAFNYQQPSLLHRTKEEFVPKYWTKMRMDQKIIRPSCEDRLSQLTTSQIDRIIDMERIRSVLYDRKRKNKQTYFSFTSTHSNHHSNVYKANFLAKINNIAIKRDIRHEVFEGFVGNAGEVNFQTDKKMVPAPYKYRKSYQSDCQSPQRKSKTHHAQDDDEKSISSIKDDLEKFEENLPSNIKSRRSSLRERKKTEFTGHIKKRWFYGLSNVYIEKPEINSSQKIQLKRSRMVDIQGELTHFRVNSEKKRKNIEIGNTKSQSSHSSAKEKAFKEPLEKFRPTKIITLS